MLINLKPLKQLSASDIFNKISQESIYSLYLGQDIKQDNLYRCCFHKDNTPSLGFYKTKYGNIRFKCFGCGEEGGCIEFVMKVTDLIYPKALQRIQSDFNLLKPLETINITNNIKSFEVKDNSLDRLKIVPIERPFAKYDNLYWNLYGLTLLDVYNSGIFACSKVFYQKGNELKLIAIDTESNPVYCIRISRDIYKIYRPLNPNKHGKWFANTGSEDLQGISLLTKERDLLIITSSMKDAVVLRKLGYQAIAPSGEGVRIPEKIMDYLIETSKKIIYFNDSDKAGYKYTFKLAKEVGLDYIFIPRYYLVKDISDFVKEYGLIEAEKLMKTLLKRVVGKDNGRERVIQNNNK